MNTGISKTLSYLLRINNLTNNDLATQVNLPRIVIKKLVAGEISNPSIYALAPIARFFGITVSQLTGESTII